MNLRRVWLPLSVGLPLLLVLGCRTLPPAGFLGMGTRLPIDDARADRVFRDYLEGIEERFALRGSARVRLEGPDFKLDRPQRILVERPARLRLEVVGLFDQLAALLATDGREFGFYDVASARISRGPVTPSLLWDLAHIDLEVHEVVGLLLGSPRPTPGVARAGVWLEPDGRIALAFGWPEKSRGLRCEKAPEQGWLDPGCFASPGALDRGGEFFVFDPDGNLVEMRSFESGGELRFRATFENHRPLGGDESRIDFPYRTTIRSPGASSLARFDWKRVMLADRIPDRFFTIPERNVSNRNGSNGHGPVGEG